MVWRNRRLPRSNRQLFRGQSRNSPANRQVNPRLVFRLVRRNQGARQKVRYTPPPVPLPPRQIVPQPGDPDFMGLPSDRAPVPPSSEPPRSRPPAPKLETGRWGTTDPEGSLLYHYKEHGREVGAKDIQSYRRKAEAAMDARQGRGTPVEGETPNVRRFDVHGTNPPRYVDVDVVNGQVISYGRKWR
jgi:hypothetical protein